MLKGKTVLLTGSTGSIGKEIAKKLSISGAKIALSATNIDKLKSLKADLGNDHLIYPCDLSDLNNINKLSEDVIGDFGTIDILINNAGIKRDDLLIRMKDDDWFDVINMNLTSVYKLTKNITKQEEVPSFQDAFGYLSCEIADNRKDTVCITAAMREGTGLVPFEKKFPITKKLSFI